MKKGWSYVILQQEHVVLCIVFHCLWVFHSISISNAPTHLAAWVANGPTATSQIPIYTLAVPGTGLWVLSSWAENTDVAVAAPALSLMAIPVGATSKASRAGLPPLWSCRMPD